MTNIELVERLIQGLGCKDVSMLPLHAEAELHTALTPGRVVRGKAKICTFLENETFPLTPPNDFPPVIERHVEDGNSVFSFWSIRIGEKTLSVLNYCEIEGGLIKLIKPYYHSLEAVDLSVR